jgi:hypothetical protein
MVAGKSGLSMRPKSKDVTGRFGDTDRQSLEQLTRSRADTRPPAAVRGLNMVFDFRKRHSAREVSLLMEKANIIIELSCASSISREHTDRVTTFHGKMSESI